jgi:hypothetical protein
VDDVLDVTVTHADGTSVARVYDFSHGCSGSIERIPEYDLSSLLEPGSNSVRIVFRDSCGFNEGNSDIYMKGDFTSEGGGSPPGTEICAPSGSGDPTDGWAYTAVITASEGLVIKDLRFGPRLVARMISVPYIRPVGFGLDNGGQRSSGHLSTSPDTQDPDLRSTLTGYSCDAADDAHHSGVSARYRVTSQSTGLTFIVQQSYRFGPFKRSERCEATESINCVRFWPTVTWALIGAAPPERDIGLNVVQRFEFDPDAVGSGAADLIADTFTRGNLGVDDLARNGRLRREDLRQVLFRGDTPIGRTTTRPAVLGLGCPATPGLGADPAALSASTSTGPGWPISVAPFWPQPTSRVAGRGAAGPTASHRSSRDRGRTRSPGG